MLKDTIADARETLHGLRKVILAVLLLILFFSVFAQGVPLEAMLKHITTFQEVWHDRCNFHYYRKVPCEIFYDRKHDEVFLILYADWLHITHVIEVTPDTKEHILWTRFNQNT